jgi:hypothetical protein
VIGTSHNNIYTIAIDDEEDEDNEGTKAEGAALIASRPAVDNVIVDQIVWGMGSSVHGVAAHPDNPTRFAAVSDDCSLRVFDASERLEIGHQLIPAGGRGAAFSPDGTIIAAGLVDGRCLLLDAVSGEDLCGGDIRTGAEVGDDVGSEVTAVRFSPSGEFVAVASMGGSVDVYSVKDNMMVREAETGTKKKTAKKVAETGKKGAAAEEGAKDGHVERLTNFYERNNPEKLDKVGSILTKYAGREEALFAMLAAKYPEAMNDGPAGEGKDSTESKDSKDDKDGKDGKDGKDEARMQPSPSSAQAQPEQYSAEWQQHKFKGILESGVRVKKHGRRGTPKYRTLWLSSDASVLRWQKGGRNPLTVKRDSTMRLDQVAYVGKVMLPEY